MTRRYREPSERNRKIWKAVRVERRDQEEVAREHQISQPRVSQIVRRMAAWYAEHSPEVNELADLAARGRLAEVEYRGQVEHCLSEAMSALRRSQQPLVTKKERRTKTIEADEVVREVVVEETVTRQQPVSTRAISLVGKHARELWELAGGGAVMGGSAAADASPATPSAPPSEALPEPQMPLKGWVRDEDANDPIKDYEIRMGIGRRTAIERLGLVRDRILTLDEAEYWSYQGAMSSGDVYPSYYEKNADGITFKVADWVREYLAPEVLHGPEWQPVFTCHDIADWNAWCGGQALWQQVGEACRARWEAWRVGQGLGPRPGDPRIYGSGFWVRHGEGCRSGAAPAPARAREVDQAGSAGPQAVQSTVMPNPGAAAQADEGPLPAVSSRQEEPPAARPPTVIERRLASGRWMPRRERNRLERMAGVQRERLSPTT